MRKMRHRRIPYKEFNITLLQKISMDNALSFKSSEDLEAWLEKNHNESNGTWLKVYKKGFASNALRSTDVLDPLLCYGWITGPAKKGTKGYVLWWICPRRKKSLWSEINKSHAERLIRNGKMKPSGMKEVEEAKKDGRWKRAYAPQSTAKLPADFLKRVNGNKQAKDFLKTLNRVNTYAIIFRLHNTKDEKKRAEKIDKIIKMLERGQAFH